MRCPFCGSFEDRVIDSRMAREGRAIRRRRACEGCNERFTTYEVIESTRPDVIKKDGRAEPFAADKVLQSLRLACKKRPIPLETLTDFIEKLESSLAAMPQRRVSSSELGDHVLAFLRGLDPVAYVRYASVYKSFGDVDEFLAELRGLRAEQVDADTPGRGDA